MKKIGEFYRENVLSQEQLILRKLPKPNDDTKIIQDLFGWKLYSGNEYIECSSEEEARFLKIFLDSGADEIYVPEDQKYIKNIVPELEKLKERHDEIINSYLRTILNKKIKQTLKNEVWIELLK